MQDFLVLCELKELLKNETCVFTAGYTLNKPTRWCFNLQRMKNEDHIGLFLKRIPTLSFKETVGCPTGKCLTEMEVANKDNGNSEDNQALVLAPDGNANGTEQALNKDEGAVYINYECTIKRSGYGEVWMHKSIELKVHAIVLMN